MSREALVLLVCCCDFRDGAERLISSKSLRNAVIRAFPGLFRILRMCAPRRAAAVVRPRWREKSADRRRRILISRLLIIRASVPRRKSPFPAYFKGFPAVSPLIPPYPAFLKYPVSPHAVINNIHQSLIERYSALTGLDDSECAKKMVFYSYAVFCSQVYLEEFYGALFVVNQSESRARIPIVDDAGLFLRLAELGERLAILEKNDAAVDNVLDFNYDELLAQMWTGFHLEHSRSASRSPYDEENEQLIVRDEVTGNSIRIYCPVSLQKFTIAGYNVIKDCWLKFHSYRFTHCDFTRDDLKELLDLFNKIASQMGIVSEIDEIMHSIVGGEVALLNYND